jgi:hypothetical protein
MGTFHVALSLTLTLNHCLASWHVVKLWNYTPVSHSYPRYVTNLSMPKRLVRATCVALVVTYTISFAGIAVYLSRVVRGCLVFRARVVAHWTRTARMFWYGNPVYMCVVGVNSGAFMAITAAPLLALELGLLLVVCWSTVARSRTTSEPLLAAFVHDGALSFLVRPPYCCAAGLLLSACSL